MPLHTISAATRLFGVYRGSVVATNDPNGQGRIQVMVPGVHGQTSGWAMPCGDYGGIKTPNLGAIAWVMFEGGDPAYPVWIGSVPGS